MPFPFGLSVRTYPAVAPPRQSDFEVWSCELTDTSGFLIPGATCPVSRYIQPLKTAVPQLADERIDISDVLLVLQASVGLFEFSPPYLWPKPEF